MNAGQKTNRDAKKHEFYRYLAGLSAGLVSTSAGYPLDVVRVRLLFKQSAITNLGSGFTFAFLVSIGKAGLVWPLQKTIQDSIRNNSGLQNELAIKFLSGACGNVIPGILFNPANVVKVRYMEDSRTNKSLHEIVSHIYHTEGWTAFKKGLGATLLRDSVWGMVYFPLYTAIRRKFSQNPSKDFWMNTSASAIAAGLSTLLTSSLDGARLFEQKTAHPEKGGHTFLKGLKMVIKPTWNNFGGTMFGVIRVTITTVLGHVTFMEIMKQLEDEEFSGKKKS